MSAEQLKSLVREVITEGWCGNLDVLQEHPGLHEIIPMLRATREGFSEIEVTFPLQFSDGEWVASRTILTHVHTGSFMGISPTHKRVEMEILMFHRIVDGKIVQQHSQADVAAGMEQLGISPGPTNG